jgi:tetratricopeptide (TPR) repeat protein
MALAAIEQRTTAAFQARRAPPDLIPRHIEALRRIGQLDPSEVGVPVALGTQHLLLAQAPAALAAYREAEALEPRPEIYLNLGRALLMSGAREDADRHFSLAARLDPTLAAEVARALQGPQR